MSSFLLSSRSFSANILTISGRKDSDSVSCSSRSHFFLDFEYLSVRSSQSFKVKQTTDQTPPAAAGSSSSAEEAVEAPPSVWCLLRFFFFFLSFFFFFFLSLSFFLRDFSLGAVSL